MSRLPRRRESAGPELTSIKSGSLEDDPAQGSDQLREGQEHGSKAGRLAGNRSDEKKTPDNSHMGSMTRFMSPLTVSVELARQATRRPSPAKASAPSRSTPTTRRQIATDRHLEHQASQKQEDDQVGDHEGQARPRTASRKSRRGIGVATNRLSSLAIRKLTSKKPTPQSPPPIALSPIKPGIRKSM